MLAVVAVGIQMEEEKLARAETLVVGVVGMPVVVRGGVADNNRAAGRIAAGLLRIPVADISRRITALRPWANRIPVDSRASHDRSRTDMLLKLRRVLEQGRSWEREEFNPVVGELAPILRAQRAESTEASPARSITIGEIVVEVRTEMSEQELEQAHTSTMRTVGVAAISHSAEIRSISTIAS